MRDIEILFSEIVNYSINDRFTCVCSENMWASDAQPLFCRFRRSLYDSDNRCCDFIPFLKTKNKKIGIYTHNFPEQSPGKCWRIYSDSARKNLHHTNIRNLPFIDKSRNEYIFLVCSAICPVFLNSFKCEVAFMKSTQPLLKHNTIKKSTKQIEKPAKLANLDDYPNPIKKEFFYCNICNNFIMERRYYGWNRLGNCEISGDYFRYSEQPWVKGFMNVKTIKGYSVCLPCYLKNPNH